MKKISLFIFSASVVFSLSNREIFAQQKAVNSDLIKIATKVNASGYVFFKENANLNPKTVFADNATAFGLGNDDKMIIYNTQTDNLGWTVYRYKQYYKSIEVNGSSSIVHYAKTYTKSAVVKIVPGLNIDINPAISESSALTKALEVIGSKLYLWQVPEAEANLKLRENNPDTSFYPKGKLVIDTKLPHKNPSADQYKLAWSFVIIEAENNGMTSEVIIDANDGSLIRKNQLSIYCDNATGTTSRNGTQSTKTDKPGTNYILYDDCGSTKIKTQRLTESSTIEEFEDADNTWSQIAAYTSHFYLRKIADYYYTVHSRTNWDGGSAINYCRVKYSFCNGCWNCWGNNDISLGQCNTADAMDDYITLDVMGHEFNHGVIRSILNITYAYESGAIDEALGDIMGEAAETWFNGDIEPHWSHREDIGENRSFSDPNSHNNPDTYGGTFWNGNAVHTDSGVGMFWFYLMCHGGTGTNDNGDNYDVSAIGYTKGARIAYRTIANYLTEDITYAEFREATLTAAEDIYGACSNEAIQCGKAWYAVGVGMGETYYDKTVSGVLPTGTYQGVNTITAGGSTTTVNSGSTVTIQAGNSSRLTPPFSAASGSVTTVKTNPCSFTVH